MSLTAAFPAVLTFCILAGFGFRLLLIDRFPLRADEAIYGFWARYGRAVDWLFLQVWPDKPPLFIAALALAFDAWGATPAAARFLNIAGSALTIPVVAVTARRWWGPLAGMVAALTMSVSPFAISFAPTVYTDPLLVLAGSLALCAAACGRPFWAGLWLGAAIMTKQQGLLYAPLVGAVLLFELMQRRKDAKIASERCSIDAEAQSGRGAQRQIPQTFCRNLSAFSLHLRASASKPYAPLGEILLFFGGLLLIVGPVLWWDSLRWAVAPSPWDLGAQNVGAVNLLPVVQWPARAQAWLAPAWYLQASWPAWVLFGSALAGATVITATRQSQIRLHACGPARDEGSGGRRRPSQLATRCFQNSPVWPVWLLLGWGLALLALHVTTSVQVWDRYLLPLAPVLALLAGWSAATLYAGWPTAHRRWLWAGCTLAALLLLQPALTAGSGRLPIGGDHGDYAGLEEALALVAPPSPITNLQSPIAHQTGAVLYHRELGWQAQFYLFDALAAGRVELRWFASAAALADNAVKTPHLRRYLVEADWAPVRDLPLQLAARQLRLERVQRVGRFTVYAIAAQPPVRDADWRVCTPTTPWPVWQPGASGDGRATLTSHFTIARGEGRGAP